MNKNTSKVTIYDIARELNISPSTVTRSLNNNKCISEKTRILVNSTADRMGYKKNKLASSLSANPIKIGMVLRNDFLPFNDLLIKGAEYACNTLSDYNTSLELSLIDIQEYNNILPDRIAELADSGCNGVIFMTTPDLDLERLNNIISEKKIYTGCVLSNCDLNEPNFYVGVDTYSSGRIAAELFSIAGLKTGDPVVIFTGTTNAPYHTANCLGFNTMNELFGFDARTIVHYDNEKIAYYAIEQVLEENPGIKGIYCSTAVTLPICKKIVEVGKQNDIFIIGTDLLSETIPYIENNTLNAVFFQNPYKIGFLAYKTIFDCIVGGFYPKTNPLYINPQIVLRSNLPYYVSRISDSCGEF